MGEALYELEEVLRSKKVNLTSQEANLLIACKAQAVRAFTVGTGAAGGVVWLGVCISLGALLLRTVRQDYNMRFSLALILVEDIKRPDILTLFLAATRRLNKLLRINLAAGIAVGTGLYRFGKSFDPCIEHILSQEGSRMQHELANIMVRKYREDQPIMRLISKHFYLENVFDDSSVDQPKLRWRYRNFFGDGAPHSERKHDSNSYNEKTNMEPEPVYMNSNINAMSNDSNPFDCVFGIPPRVEEINHPASSITSSRRQSRSQKRSHRRQRMRKREASSTSEHADLVPM